MQVVDLTSEDITSSVERISSLKANDVGQSSDVLRFYLRSALSEWFRIEGDDCEHLRTDAEKEWKRIVRIGDPWTDSSFPPSKDSVLGSKESTETSVSLVFPVCRCGTTAKSSTVQKDTPNKGRLYFHCASRRCGFFAWADPRRESWADLTWNRFQTFVLVTDYGFHASDLLQGGVGDCWFLSALAVVAERHDLIAKLFADTKTNTAGCYNIRLFLDGSWRTILVDDNLPCTTMPRRPELTGDTGLAFSRASGNQLWVCLAEKAYAKAHGSYRAISGGEIAEALLDLTGAPTATLHFDSDDFNLEALWDLLVRCKAEGLPMGCATAGDPQLREVGLCGNHAYSILECRELADSASEGGRVRLLRIRNPHGVGEWNGEWSDASERWSSIAATAVKSLERTGVNDGTFWMDLTHFVMGFSLVDVSLAHRGWHAYSLPNSFCSSGSCWRVCSFLYQLRTTVGPAAVYISALQPTRRGAWCRADRKRSYKPGDVSLMLVSLENGVIKEVVAGGLGSAQGGRNTTISATLNVPCADYLLIAWNLGMPPTAAEVAREQPFHIRIYSSTSLQARKVEFNDEDGPAATASLFKGLSSVGNSIHEVSNSKVTGCSGLICNEWAVARLRRRWHSLGVGLGVCEIRSGGDVVVCMAVNQTATSFRFEACAAAKVVIARGCNGLLNSEGEIAAQLNAAEAEQAGANARNARSGFRWPAKWKHFRATTTVPGVISESGSGQGWQRLLLVLIPSGMQSCIGRLSFRVWQSGAPDPRSTVTAEPEVVPERPTKRQQTLEHWIVVPPKKIPQVHSRLLQVGCGLFQAVPEIPGFVRACQMVGQHSATKLNVSCNFEIQFEDEMLQRALEQSVRDNGHITDDREWIQRQTLEIEECDLKAALTASVENFSQESKKLMLEAALNASALQHAKLLETGLPGSMDAYHSISEPYSMSRRLNESPGSTAENVEKAKHSKTFRQDFSGLRVMDAMFKTSGSNARTTGTSVSTSIDQGEDVKTTLKRLDTAGSHEMSGKDDLKAVIPKMDSDTSSSFLRDA